MLILICFIFAVVGLTQIIVESELFNAPKIWLSKRSDLIQQKIDVNTDVAEDRIMKMIVDKILYMSKCYQCSGFWSGFWITFLVLYFNLMPNSYTSVQTIVASVIGGWAGSLFGNLGFYVIGIIEKIWNRK